MRTIWMLVCLLPLAGCGDSVASDEEARRAYLGIDPSIDKAITLGFQGFNAASSANIAPQAANGDVSGTLTVTGQVDQGNSANKGMRLQTGYVMYSDDGKIVYATGATKPELDMMLKGIPTGTLTGSMNGVVTMTGEEQGELTLALTFSGELEAGPNNTVQRKAGTTHVTGTATSAAGTYTVDVTR